jgi:hypothetical protein
MRDAQREILTSLGYKLVQRHTFEDWWVDPNIIPAAIIDLYRDLNDDGRPKYYFDTLF